MFLSKFIFFSVGDKKKKKKGDLQQCYDDLLWLNNISILFHSFS